MPTLSEKSLGHLSTCHPDIQLVILEAAKRFDLSVLCGYRDQAAQEEAYRKGFSKKRWPDSAHNILIPGKGALAVDIAPWPILWKDARRFYYLAGYVVGIAHRMGVGLSYGGDWDGDGEILDQDWYDLGHFELTRY